MVLSGRERVERERLVRGHSTGQQLVVRARIVWAAGAGHTDARVACRRGLDDETPGHWRRRWLQVRDAPLAEVSAAQRRADAPRAGAPARRRPEQVGRAIALACEQPADSDRPISRWSQRELAEGITRRGIVARIAPRHAGRLLTRGRPAAAPGPGPAHAGGRRSRPR